MIECTPTRWWAVSTVVAGLSLTWICPAVASEPGDAAAAMVTMESYRHFLDDELYTHDGDNRHWGPEHDLARDNIVANFQSFGLQVELHPFDYQGETYYNVVATQLGTLFPDQQYIVGGHFDSYNSPGADDDASGVAGILELARNLSWFPSDRTIKYIAFDREEQWMIGSYAYVDDHWDDQILGMISMDMIAWDSGDFTCYIEGQSESDTVKYGLADAINEYSQGVTVVVGGPSFADHVPFEEAGFEACLLIEDTEETIWGGEGNPCYHQSCDSVDNPGYISYDYATEITRGVIGFLVDNAGVQVSNCGDGAVQTGETCDTGILSGQPGACPTDCDSQDECIIDTLLDPGTCVARCDAAPITRPVHDDGCCPPGAHAVSDNDCDPVCGNGVCEMGEDTGCLADCLCDDDSECEDSFVCTVDQCVGGMCTYTRTTYGDVRQDGTINVFDLFCVLDGFSGQFDNCTFKDVDINPCDRNMVVNVFDLFAVLNAFGGEDPCCAGLP